MSAMPSIATRMLQRRNSSLSAADMEKVTEPDLKGAVGAHQCAAAAVLRRTSEMILPTSSAIFGPCSRISENSASEIR